MTTPRLFRTVVPVSPSKVPLDLGSPVLCLGSCFAEVIGRRLTACHFDADTNPFGTLYNPASIAHALERIRSGEPYRRDDLFEHGGLWASFDHHAALSSGSARACLAAINARLRAAHSRFRTLHTLIVTFGSSFAWFLRDSGRLVANCHKLPSSTFVRRLLDVDEIADDWGRMLDTLYADTPGLSVIVTISPIRHMRDKPHENSISKGALVTAVNHLERRFPDLHYFPAYEIVLDELRDYRFYAPDCAHLSDEAEEYVWERFVDAAIGTRGRAFIRDFEPVRRALGHRLLRPRNPSARSFAAAHIALIDKLEAKYPKVRLLSERERFERIALAPRRRA